MSAIYISSYSKERAQHLASLAIAAGNRVVSTWHDGECQRTADRTEEDLSNSSIRNIALITGVADCVILDCADDLTPGGTFLEAGAAIASSIEVFAVNGLRPDGTRRNNVLYHPLVSVASDDTAAIQAASMASRDTYDDEDDDFDIFDDDMDDDDDDWEDDDEDWEDDDEDFDDDMDDGSSPDVRPTPPNPDVIAFPRA